MTINYTTLLGLGQPVTGTESGVWGTVVNDQITALVEDAIANAATINVTAGDVTLTTTNGAVNQARMMILLVTGTPGVSRNVIAPSKSKFYLVKNSSDASVVIKGAATTGVTLLTSTTALVFWNGTDFERAVVNGPSTATDNAVARFDGTTGEILQNSGVIIDDSNNVSGIATLTSTTLTPTNALGVGYGGTGLTAGTSGGVLYYSATGTLASSAALASSALVVGGGAGVAPSTITTGTGVTTALGVNAGSAGAFVVNGGALGTPSGGTVTNLTGTASININGTVGATTPSTGVFTTATARAAATQDSVILQGRAGGTNSYGVTMTPTTLSASRTLTLPDASGTILQSGTAVTVGQGGTGLTAGTSGGIPYFSSTSAITSSAALASNALVVGGGAGASPATVTTGTGVVTALGVNVGSAGAFVVNGGALGTPSSGTVTNLTGTASININGTVGATTPTTATFTTGTALQIINTVNPVTVTSNAGTVPIAYRINNFTNSSAATMTITLATASAVDGQMSIVRIYDFSAAAQTISWVNTENSNITVPTTSNGSTTLPLTVGFMYNSQTSRWRCIASA